MDFGYYEQQSDLEKKLYFKLNINDWVPAHIHNSIELLFVKKGKIEVSIEGETRVLTDGMIAVTNSLEVHRYQTIDYSETYVLVLGKAFFQHFYKDGNCLKNFLEPSSKSDVIFFMLDYFDKNRDDFNEWMLSGFFDFLIGLLIKEYGYAESKTSHTGEFTAVLRYINEHYTEPLTLATLANEFGYSRAHFSVIFNKKMNIHLNEYINLLRLARVKELLEKDSAMTVQEATSLAGFSSVETYYRVKRRRNEMFN